MHLLPSIAPPLTKKKYGLAHPQHKEDFMIVIFLISSMHAKVSDRDRNRKIDREKEKKK